MCPLAGWASSGLMAAARTHFAASGVRLLNYAMNMRAAEAIVSNAPKAMKIFPISEV
jgi:hypothetical protein